MRTCERWRERLDAQGPDGLSPGDLAHAADCPGCAHALAAAHAVDRLLATAPVPAPAGFTDAVMARVAAVRRAPVPAAPVGPPRARLRTWSDPMPAWIRFAAEPVTAGALVIGALLVWQAPRLMALGRALASILAAGAAGSASQPAPLLPGLPPALGSDPVRLALLATAASLMPLAGVALYRWTERWIATRARAR